MADEEIISLILGKNEYGLTLLQEKYDRLLNYIVGTILGSHKRDIEECINDTYLKFWKSAESFDMEKATLSTYLKVIARNTAINRLRDIKRHEDKASLETIDDIAYGLVDHTQNIENQIERNELVKRLNIIVSTLPETDRELMIRKYFYAQSSKQIAEGMKMSVTAVDSRLSRLRTKMKSEVIGEL